LESKKPAFQWIGLIGLDKFIDRLHASCDEKEIFLEKTSRKAEEKELSEKPKLSRQSSLNIHSEHSAFKPRDGPAAQPHAMLENLLYLLLDFCKKGMIPNMENKEAGFKPLSQDSSFLQISKNKSSPASIEDMGRSFVTPNIRKSVSIIVNIQIINKLIF